MRHEGVPIARREVRHPVGIGIQLVLEEDREVVLADTTEANVRRIRRHR
jgi:hypothetical protein